MNRRDMRRQGATDDSFDGAAILSRVTRRLIPFLVLCYVAAYLDRVNLSFAAATMNGDLKFSPSVYGWGAGVFFIGYALLETPSNYILHRIGARIWIARIMVSWGLVSAAMAFVSDETSFYLLRFLLGAAEAGFMPGIILYLTYWFPQAQRGRILAAFLFAVPLATVIGAPLSGVVLSYAEGLGGMRGWRWLFILEAAPAIGLGVVAWFYLTDRPATADWLAPVERDWLSAQVAGETGAAHESDGTQGTLPTGMAAMMGAVIAAVRDRRALGLGAAYFGVVLALYGLGMWLPQIIEGYGLGPLIAGFVAALPFLFGACAMLWWSRRSDRRGERVWHTALAACLAAAGLAAAAAATTPVMATAAICLAAIGVFAVLPPFWALVTGTFQGADAALAIALINSIGNLAGFFGPWMVGWLKEASGGYGPALLALATGPLACAALVVYLGPDRTGPASNGRRP
jgi:ACS family tartrate transporter-like MFS transporter